MHGEDAEQSASSKSLFIFESDFNPISRKVATIPGEMSRESLLNGLCLAQIDFSENDL